MDKIINPKLHQVRQEKTQQTSPHTSSSLFFCIKQKYHQESRIFINVFVYVYFLKVSFCFNFQASISSLEITDISSYLGLGCTSFPFCLELAVISPELSHEMWIFLTMIFAVIGLLSGYFCLGFLWWSKSAKDPNSELQWN